MKLEIKPLQIEHVSHVINNMTEEDRAEVVAAKIDPILSFTHGFKQSPISGIFALGDEALAIWGCIPDDREKDTGIPWMVATPEFRNYPRDAAELTMNVVEHMNHSFPKLHNLVHKNHEVAKRWLSWCGFQVFDKLIGPGNQFHYFVRYGDIHV